MTASLSLDGSTWRSLRWELHQLIKQLERRRFAKASQGAGADVAMDEIINEERSGLPMLLAVAPIARTPAREGS
jgi:hypothetical protein